MKVERKRCAIYTRVSSVGQQTDSQERELIDFVARRGWTVSKLYSDKGISGTKESRPGLDELMKDCRRRRFEIVAVWKFDRFARSVKHLVTALHEFHELGIDFVSLTEQVDTTTAMGKMTFHVLGAVAELERSMLAERTVAGLREARRRGKRLGRPPAEVPLEVADRMKTDRKRGKLSLRRIARKHGVTLWRVQKLLGGISVGA